MDGSTGGPDEMGTPREERAEWLWRQWVTAARARQQAATGCPDISRLLAFVTPGLGPEESGGLMQHLAVCVQCRKVVREVRRARQSQVLPKLSFAALKLAVDRGALTARELRGWFEPASRPAPDVGSATEFLAVIEDASGKVNGVTSIRAESLARIDSRGRLRIDLSIASEAAGHVASIELYAAPRWIQLCVLPALDGHLRGIVDCRWLELTERILSPEAIAVVLLPTGAAHTGTGGSIGRALERLLILPDPADFWDEVFLLLSCVSEDWAHELKAELASLPGHGEGLAIVEAAAGRIGEYVRQWTSANQAPERNAERVYARLMQLSQATQRQSPDTSNDPTVPAKSKREHGRKRHETEP